ncbi:MAG: hypothetical protein V1892_03070 [bacterium]
MLLNKENFKVIIVRNLIKYFYLIIFLIIVIIGLIGYYYLFLPKIEQIRELQDVDFSAKQTDFSKKSEHLKKVEALQKNYQTINADDLEKIKQVIPEGPDLSGLFVQLQSLGREFDLQLISVAVTEEKSNQGKGTVKEGISFNLPGQEAPSQALSGLNNVKKLNINLQYQGLGNYASFKSFLLGFENHIRLFDINNLSFTLAKTGEKSGMINLNFTTYYLEI